MSRIEELIQKLCPDGVEYKMLYKIADIKRGERVTKAQLEPNLPYPVISGGMSALGFYDKFNREKETITIAQYGSAGYIDWQKERFWANDVCYSIFPKKGLVNKYLYYYLMNKQEDIYALKTNAIPAHLPQDKLSQVLIPIPPLEIQEEIVRILDMFTSLEAELEAELEARKTQYEHYRDSLLRFEGKEVEWKTLDVISKNFDSKRKPVRSSDRKSGQYPYYGASGIVDYVSDYIFDGDYLLISEDGANLLARSTPIAFSISGKTWVNNHAHVLKFDNYATRRLVEIYLNSIDLSKYISGAAQPKLNKENLNKIPIPIPAFSEQEKIVAALDKFDTLVNDISIGLPAEIEARRKQYQYYRNRLLSFKQASNG